MKIIENIWEFTSNVPSVVTIGTFDGVHIGHQKIIQRLVSDAENEALTPTILTFFPHPKTITDPENAPKQLQTLSEKIKKLQEFGVQQLVIQSFTKEFSELSANDFVKEILIKRLNIRKIIIGYDHRFGKNRSADIQDLRKFGAIYGFSVEEISAQEIDTISVSSTKIRKALSQGLVQTANTYLGHDFTISGEVIHGQKLGRKLGFPTANIRITESYKLVPKEGAYVVTSTIDNQRIYGMMNIGKKPTLEGNNQTIEVYFFDFSKDLYGRFLEISLLDFLREEEKFTSLEALKNQLKKDEEKAKLFLSKKAPHY